LADLETIYRNLYRITDADRCRRTIDSILQSTSDFSQDKFLET
jgi:hypothetical protein